MELLLFEIGVEGQTNVRQQVYKSVSDNYWAQPTKIFPKLNEIFFSKMKLIHCQIHVQQQSENRETEKNLSVHLPLHKLAVNKTMLRQQASYCSSFSSITSTSRLNIGYERISNLGGIIVVQFQFYTGFELLSFHHLISVCTRVHLRCHETR